MQPCVTLTVLMTLENYNSRAKNLISPVNKCSYFFSTHWHECYWMIKRSQTLSEKVTDYVNACHVWNCIAIITLKNVVVYRCCFLNYLPGKVYLFLLIWWQGKKYIWWPLKLFLTSNWSFIRIMFCLHTTISWHLQFEWISLLPLTMSMSSP